MPAPEVLEDGLTRWVKRGALICFGYLACAWVHQTQYSDNAAKVLPQVQAQAGCEHWRADKNAQLALGSGMVTKAQLPKDNCPHPSVPPQQHPVP